MELIDVACATFQEPLSTLAVLLILFSMIDIDKFEKVLAVVIPLIEVRIATSFSQ
jgi:hypothetical protein